MLCAPPALVLLDTALPQTLRPSTGGAEAATAGGCLVKSATNEWRLFQRLRANLGGVRISDRPRH